MRIQKIEGTQYYKAKQGLLECLGYSAYEAISRLLSIIEKYNESKSMSADRKSDERPGN